MLAQAYLLIKVKNLATKIYRSNDTQNLGQVTCQQYSCAKFGSFETEIDAVH